MRSRSAAFRGLLAGLIGTGLAVAAISTAYADPPWGWHHGWHGGWDHHWHPPGWWHGGWWGPGVYYSSPPPVYYAPPPPAYYAPPPVYAPPSVTFGFAFR
jgi:hypothetical protein